MKWLRRVLSDSVVFASVGFGIGAAAGAVPAVGSIVFISAINVFVVAALNGQFLLGFFNDPSIGVVNFMLIAASIVGLVASAGALYGIYSGMESKLSVGWVIRSLVVGAAFIIIAFVAAYTQAVHWSRHNGVDLYSFPLSLDYAFGVVVFSSTAGAAAGLVGAFASAISRGCVRVVRVVTYVAISVVIGGITVFGEVASTLVWGIGTGGIVSIIGNTAGAVVVVLAAVVASRAGDPATEANLDPGAARLE